MSTTARLAAFTSGLVVAFGAAWGLGSSFDPLLDEPVPAHESGAHDGE